MSMLVANCPRCGSNRMTFTVTGQAYRESKPENWRHRFEVFAICRGCGQPTIFLLVLQEAARSAFVEHKNAVVDYNDGILNELFTVDRFISLRDTIRQRPPEHVAGEVASAFNEGAACLAIECFNAASAMFRLCIDVVTKPLLPKPDDQNRLQPPNNRTRRDLGLRLAWMFDNGVLPIELKELAKCVREDGNDGAHVGNLTREDAEDLIEFTTALLERLITEPQKLKLAEERRKERRKGI